MRTKEKRDKLKDRVRSKLRYYRIRNTEEYKARKRKNQLDYYHRNVEYYREYYRKRRKTFKHKANMAVINAIKQKKLIRPSKCSMCMIKTPQIQAHHPDYRKPLYVIWLCKTCHFMVHRGAA